MLIQTPIAPGDTVTIKTTAGEEIVARLDEIKPDVYKVSKPMTIMATPQGVGLGPLSFTVNPDTKIELNKHAVLFIAKTDPEMAKQYVSSTTGIKMV